MKRLIKVLVIAVLAIALLSIFPQKIPSSEEPGTYYCVVYFVMENKDRYCYHAPNTECGPIHDPPFGNWGEAF